MAIKPKMSLNFRFWFCCLSPFPPFSYWITSMQSMGLPFNGWAKRLAIKKLEKNRNNDNYISTSPSPMSISAVVLFLSALSTRTQCVFRFWPQNYYQKNDLIFKEKRKYAVIPQLWCLTLITGRYLCVRLLSDPLLRGWALCVCVDRW